MNNTTLVIMAAGIGARFGEGIKQLQRIGPNDEIIMDYSIHDAILAGFNKVVFIIRKDIERDFKKIIGDRTQKICNQLNVKVEYVFQSIMDVPEGVVVPEGRTKPWGTGQAVLSAKDCIHEPFAVINADDYYGNHAFQAVHDYLIEYGEQNSYNLCMAGYHLKNTLSDYGSVTRGICHVDEDSYLISIDEVREIQRKEQIITSSKGVLEKDTCVSMNMFGMGKDFLQLLDQGFCDFFKNNDEDDLKKEFLIPVFIDKLLHERKISVKVLETKDQWFGITYQEDVDGVKRSFENLYQQGIYQNDLFNDLQ
ncbi:MAG: nucleotidyltransferase [Lachnospiraceae bacterium]|nr:nucleotidyltransferase [Lachnospiraceae bacterium]